MSKSKKISIIALAVSLLCFTVFFWATNNREFLQVSEFLDRWFPLILGTFVGSAIIIGTVYLYLSKKLKPEYKTYPLYGVAALLEGIGSFLQGTLQVLFTSLGILAIIIAVTIDVRKKTGLYYHFFAKRK